MLMGRPHLKNHAAAFVLRCITSLAKAIGAIMTKIFWYWMQFSKTLKCKLLLFFCHRIATQFRVVDLQLYKLL